jgi:peptidoglycan/xylan/chitin deacetylase (PgdA/CDA1 family)
MTTGTIIRQMYRRVFAAFAHLRPRGLVLLYHRVAELDSDPWALATTPAHFAEHLEVLRSLAHVVPLRDLTDAAARRKLRHGSVAITFDDGYADNLHVAKPLLERHDAPATVFTATGALTNPRLYWWDELDRILLQSATLPSSLRIEIEGVPHEWSLEAPSRGTEHRPDPAWRTGHGVETARQRAFLELWRRMQMLGIDAREAVLDELTVWAGAGVNGQRSGTPMSSTDLHRLSEDGLVEVGAHTVSHPALARQPLHAQRQEIEQSKAVLEEVIGRPITSFAYPFGGPAECNEETARLVRAAGFERACTTSRSTVTSSSDPYLLPRIYMDDCDGDGLARILWEQLGIGSRQAPRRLVAKIYAPGAAAPEEPGPLAGTAAGSE